MWIKEVYIMKGLIILHKQMHVDVGVVEHRLVARKTYVYEQNTKRLRVVNI